jgi:DNA polymerase IV
MPKLAHFRAKHDGATPEAAPTSASVLHLDMDAFFVSVELLERPDLRGKPVIVGGARDVRGVVTSASYEARKFGVHSAMALRTAAKLCPQAVFLENRHALYTQWSDRVAEILARYSPIVEMASIDEAYLNLAGTEKLLGQPFAAAHSLLTEITRTTGLPCSAGLAATRLVAKVASDQAKPRGLLWVPAGSEEIFLAPLGVRKIPGIGKVTEAALHSLGIKTVGQLAGMPREKLDEHFGQWGSALHRKARGADAFEFFVDAEAKSISHNHTFGFDTGDGVQIRSMLSHLGEKAAKRLRDSGLSARCITLTIRYANFHTTSHARTLTEPTDLDTVILATLRELFDARWDRSQNVRLVGAELSSFSHGAQQLDLLDPQRREKMERLAKAADQLRDRFGFSKLQYGGSMGHDDDHGQSPRQR